MKNNDCLLSDIQNLCNAVSDWLIQKINNPIETNETISCACCHHSFVFQFNQIFQSTGTHISIQKTNQSFMINHCR